MLSSIIWDNPEYSENKLLPSSGTGEDPTVTDELKEESLANKFPLESHLEDFIIDNWEKTTFGKHYDLESANALNAACPLRPSGTSLV